MGAKDVFSDALMAQLLELHASVLAEHNRSLKVSSADFGVAVAEPIKVEETCQALQVPSNVRREPSYMRREPSELAQWESGWRPSGIGVRIETATDTRVDTAHHSKGFVLHSNWVGDENVMRIASRLIKCPEERPRKRTVTLDGDSLVRSQTKMDLVSRMDCCQPFIAHPNSKKRLVWDVFGLLLICYDIIVLPLQVFDLGGAMFFRVMESLSIIFWTLDLPSSFFVGFHTLGGSLMMGFQDIAKRYVLSWFPLDLFLITLDWIILAIDDEGDSNSSFQSAGLARLGKTVRVMRLLRMLRLMRLAKIPKYFLQIEEHIRSEYAVVIIGILKLTACILVINHLIACGWYAIGNLEEGSEKASWVKEHVPSNSSTLYIYTTSMHWSLTQFTPASMEIFPQNSVERSFALVVLVFALITFSSFVSSITNAMTHLRNMNSEFAKQFVQLGRYLRYHKISTPLAVRVRRHLARTIVKRQRRLEESEVTLLRLLSEPLLMDLRLEVFRPLLEHHPFFQRYFERNVAAARKVCHTAITEISLASGDLLFSPGEMCDRMFFVKTGTLRYTHDFENDEWRDLTDEDFSVGANEWICEACLWTEWRHCGYMHAFAGSSLVALEVEKFFDVARRTRTSAMSPARYGELFVNHLNSFHSTELTDMHLQSFNFEEALEKSCAYSEEVASQMHAMDIRSQSSMESSKSETTLAKEKALAARYPKMTL